MIDENLDNIQALNDKIEGFSSEMRELKTRMQRLESDIRDIKTKVGGLEAKVDALEIKITNQVQGLKDIWWMTIGLLATVIAIVIAILRFFP